MLMRLYNVIELQLASTQALGESALTPPAGQT